MKTTLPLISYRVAKQISFWLCLLAAAVGMPFAACAQPTVNSGKSYINISRPNGGTFLPGDILEVRATIAVAGGNNSDPANRLNSVRYNDTVNSAFFTYVPNSLRYTTNEGRNMVPGLGIPAFTDAADTDSAHIDLATGRIRFNIGFGATAANVTTQTENATGGGALWGNLFPRFSNTCIRMYVYRVVINPATVSVGMTITLPAGNFRYRFGNGATGFSNFQPYRIKIAPDYGLCSNAIGTNAILGESGGTFGSGSTQNKAGGSSFVPAPYTFVNFSGSGPNDNFYGVANRTSANNSTSNTVPYWSGTNRVFTVWEIIGDHTGAADPIAGNPPTNNGYALIINASYQTNRAFTQNITNLCENTYYEFSAWFRNICQYCSSDSSGKGGRTTGFVPGPGTTPGVWNDTSGVKPNLSFQIDGEEYYTSGNILFTGTWVKKGFVFKTAPGQTAMTLTIRNNAPGGGGNDWAIDDITLATCLPNMSYSPSLTPNVCEGGALTLNDTVRSFFDNYVYYKWQRSTNGGSTWSDVSAPFGPVPPGSNPNLHHNGSAWEYVASYTVPPSLTLPANSGDQYRVVVATSFTNLSDMDCSSTDATNAITMNVVSCGPVLGVDFTSFTARQINNRTTLNWSTAVEREVLVYSIEKSLNGTDFLTIASFNNDENFDGRTDQYSFTDPEEVTSKAYYRIKMRSADGRTTYSRTVYVSAVPEQFAFGSVINPFTNKLQFDISAIKRGMVKMELVNHLGQPVRRKATEVVDGVSQLSFENTGSLPAGIYVLKAELNGLVIYRKVLKQN
jgi:trimeric autotransporter adhesin